MVRDGKQSVIDVRPMFGSTSEPADERRESDLLQSLRKQNFALDQLRQALDDDLLGPDDLPSNERYRLEAGLLV